MRYSVVLCVVISFLSPGQPPVQEIMRELDQLYRSDDSHAFMEMRIVTENWERTLEMEAWSLGREKTFIRVLSPAREAGSATLRVGSEMWNYRPNTGSVVRIPPSMMTGSWMGSDLTNNDIVKEITYEEDYTAEYLSPPGDSPEGTLLLKLTPDPSTAVVWSYIIAEVRTDPLIPVREEYYDRNDGLIKTIVFSGVETMDGRTIPTVMEVIPAEEEGESTTVTWSDVTFNGGVDDDIFTLANLQSGGGR